MRLILMGMPGVGKGTQAKKICQKLNIPHISTGDILREAVKNKTEMGIIAQKHMDSGQLVPDEIILGIINDRLKESDCLEGYILDGFPRTVVQANALAGLLKEISQTIDYVINLEVPASEVLRRLSGRRVCSECGQMFHVAYNKPKKDGVCDNCQGGLYQREDDQEASIQKRLEQYREQTAPLINYYEGLGTLQQIEARGGIEDIFQRILAIINGI